jgi:tetratricopeptide (TPR) repeat protein
VFFDGPARAAAGIIVDKMGRPKPVHVDSAAGVARRLTEARLRAGMSQRALAFDGCSPAYVSRIESGERVPSPPLLRELARRVGVSEAYLARGADREATVVSELIEADLAAALDETTEARRLYDLALERAADPKTRAAALEGLGKLELREGRMAEAIGYLERALAVSGDEPWRRPGLAEALARAHGGLGDNAPAIALLERCVDAFEREGDSVQYVRFAALLSYALTDNGSFAEAERIVSKALSTGREIADPYTRVRLYWSQLRLRGEQGQNELAEHYARKALETLRSTEDTHAVALALQALAHLKLDTGAAEEALELLAEGWPHMSSSGSPVQIAHYRIEEVRALAALGEHERAASLAMEISATLHDAHPADAGRAYVVLAEVFDELGQDARAKELYELGIEYLEQQPPSRYLISAYRRLAELVEADGRQEEALTLLKRAVGAQERVGRMLV